MKKMDDDPRASAAALLPKAAKANKPIFYERQGRRMQDRLVREVHEAFEAMMDKRTSRYEDVEFPYSRLVRSAKAYGSFTIGTILARLFTGLFAAELLWLLGNGAVSHFLERPF